MLRSGSLIIGTNIVCFISLRPLLLEFATKALKLQPDQVFRMPAYRMLTRDYAEHQNAVVKAKILAYSLSTWRGHISSYQGFLKFCNAKQVDPVTCTPPTIGIYLLELAGAGKSIGVINRAMLSITFIHKWFLLADLSNDQQIVEILQFLSKTCPRVCNTKQALGVREIRKVWDALLVKYGDITHVPDIQLRTFVMLVTQHASFCRFSDISTVRLNDLLH
jgi:hypothetical protein